MRHNWPLVVGFLAALLPAHVSAQGATARSAFVKPQYLSPAELARTLGVTEREGMGVLGWHDGEAAHRVEVRRNDAANLLMLLGPPDDVAAVEGMIRAADVPPRQILVEARIVEVDRDRALDAGIDWSIPIFLRENFSWDWSKLRRRDQFQSTTLRDERTAARTSVDAQQTLMLLDRAGAATIRDVPRILTLNNRRATILDGQRVTYVTRYSSFTNLFETDTLDAGLTLSVLPSLGESGYLTLEVRAELTNVTGNISGSPVKDGQIVENTVIARDGETILLGGFVRTVEERSHRRFPLLGRVLPFLFSREISTQSRRESFVALTPRVVDLAATVDPATREILEGR